MTARDGSAWVMIRQSLTRGQATISLPQQEADCRAKAAALGLRVAGVSTDPSTSAFKIPPMQRKGLREGLDRAAEYGTLIYYQQSRLCRRLFPDFAGMIEWAKANNVRLVSATEAGDPLEASGQLSAVVIAWKDDNESQAKSDKMKSVQRDLHAAGRWTGGRVPFGKRAICLCHGREICPDLKNCQGWELDTHEANAGLLRDVAPKVIAGKSVNAVTADLNSAEIPSADGKAWSSHTLRKILRNPASAYVIGAGAWSDVQAALGHSPTSGNRGTRTATDNALLDIIWCGDCADAKRENGKLYRWHRARTGTYHARCRNELKRADLREPCGFPMAPYDFLEALIGHDILKDHGDDLIQERVTSGAAGLAAMRRDAIDGELISLAAQRRTMTREDFHAKQDALERELDALDATAAADDGPAWLDTGETVAERWYRLSPADRRLWLLRIGTTFTVYRTRADGTQGWRIEPSWYPDDETERRERIVRAPAVAVAA